MASPTRVADWVEEQRRRKWRWAGHVARRDDGRWSKMMLDWVPVRGQRGAGRPVTRWEDPIAKYAKAKGFNWRECALDRDGWANLEKEFVSQSW